MIKLVLNKYRLSVLSLITCTHVAFIKKIDVFKKTFFPFSGVVAWGGAAQYFYLQLSVASQ